MFKLSAIRKFLARHFGGPSKKELQAEVEELRMQLQRAHTEKRALQMDLLDEQVKRDLKELDLHYRVEELEAANRDVKFSFQKELAVERANGATYRKQVREMRDNLFLRGLGLPMRATEETMETSAPEKSNTQQKKGPVCEICQEEYSLKTGRIPRSLECGHTTCEGCCEQMEADGVVRCPFDRHDTKLPLIGVVGLPRNFVIIQMLDDCQ